MLKQPAPPPLAARLLAAALGSGEFADSVVGDLHEEWAARVARGVTLNAPWYWWQVVTIGTRTAVELRRRRGSQLVAGTDTRASQRLAAAGGDVWRGVRVAGQHRLLLVLSSLAIALGVASPTTIFSIVRGLSRDLPFPEGDRIVYITRPISAPVNGISG